MADLLFHWFHFNETSKSYVNFNINKSRQKKVKLYSDTFPPEVSSLWFVVLALSTSHSLSSTLKLLTNIFHRDKLFLKIWQQSQEPFGRFTIFAQSI